jgi:membrane-bound serine protease (ClpP class)
MPIRRLIFAVLVFCFLAGWTVHARGDDGAAAPSASPAVAPAGHEKAVVITLAGEVDDYNRDALFRNIERARKLGAKTVILRMNTYGGLVSSGLDIARFLRRQDDLHIVAFVDDKAISAGAMIALACNEIVMVPSAVLGDCAPIVFKSDGNLESMPVAERAKAESPILKDFEASAARNGYDPLLVTSMVSAPKVVYYVEDNEGHRKFVDEPTYQKLTKDEEWKPVAGVSNPLDGPTTLLTVTTDEALKLGLAKGQVHSVDELAGQRGYTVVADFSPTAGDRIVSILGNPLVRGILLIIFLNSLFVAFKMPGHGAPEAIALLSLGVLVGVPLLTGYATWWEILIILGGLGLVAFEIFVFPGHMVSLLVGSVMVFAGLLLTFVGDTVTMPGGLQMPSTWVSLEHGLYVIVGGLVCSMLLSAWLRRYLPKMPYFNRLILTTNSGGGQTGSAARADEDPADADAWPFIGTVGVAVSELKPGGRAEFPYGGDRRVTGVVCETGCYVPAGTRLAVLEVRGSRVVVRPLLSGEDRA